MSGHTNRDTQAVPAAPSDEYRALRILAEMLWDAQKTRIGMSNRAERADVVPEIYKPHIENMAEIEHKLALALRKQYRITVAPRIRTWQQESPGIGEHLLARLLGCIGDPVLATPQHWEGTGKSSGGGYGCNDTQTGVAVTGEETDGGHSLSDNQIRGAASQKSDDSHHLCDVHRPCAVVGSQTGSETQDCTATDEAPSHANRDTQPRTAGRHLVADEPYQRMVSQLWAYCGVGDPERKRHAGMDKDEALACGKPLAKSLCRLLAESCVKVNRGPYREVYDLARIRYATRLHKKPCVRCGPSGKPAAEGSPWSAAHQHGAALRLVSKEILKDLWLNAGGTTRYVAP